MSKHGIDTKCQKCGKIFKKWRRDQYYCGDDCRMASWKQAQRDKMDALFRRNLELEAKMAAYEDHEPRLLGRDLFS